MSRAERETTAPMKRDELLGLLDAMAETTATATRPKRPTAPFAHIAALLPPCEPKRFSRATRPPPLVRARTVTEKRAAQAIEDARARLDTADETAAERAAARERVSFAALSPQVVAQLSGDEIAMLPMEMRLTLPEPPDWAAPPRIEITPVPGDAVFIVSTPSGQLNVVDMRRRFPTRAACVAVLLTALACIAYAAI